MEAILAKLRGNLSQDTMMDLEEDANTSCSKIDLEYALNNPYQTPTSDKMKTFTEDLEEFKFNQKLQTISNKRQQIPNLQVFALLLIVKSC